MCFNFQEKRTTLTFSAQIWSKKDFRVESPDTKSVPPIYDMYRFSVKVDNFEFCGQNLGKLPNCMQYFGSNNVETVTESWVEAEMSCMGWMELGEG